MRKELIRNSKSPLPVSMRERNEPEHITRSMNISNLISRQSVKVKITSRDHHICGIRTFGVGDAAHKLS